MKKFTLIPILASALLTLGSSALSAQEAKVKRADTLRRELTVMTEDEVTLGTRQPRDLSYVVPVPSVTAVRHAYLDTPIPFALRPGISPLGALTAPRGGFDKSDQRGYVYLSGGFSYGMKAGAGLRLLSTKTDRWDVFGRYLWTRSDMRLPLGSAQKIREDAWLLGSSYEHHFDEATLDLKLTAGQHGYNYYGLDLTRPLLGVPLGSIAFGPELRRRSTLVSVGARYATEEDFTEDWLYDFGARVDYTSSRSIQGASATLASPREWLPELSADLSYRLGSTSRLGAMGEWSLGSLSSSVPFLYGFPEKRTSSTRMILTGVPYFLTEDVSGDLGWRALAGLRVLTGNDHYNAHLFLFPKIDAKLSIGSAFDIRLQTDAQLLRHSLHRIADETPYLDHESFVGRYERLYDVKLSLGGTIGGAFSIEAFGRYADHKGAAEFRPSPLLHPDGLPATASYLMPITFRPYYVDYREQNLGLELAYNHRGLFTTSLRGVYARYQTTQQFLSRPSFTLESLVELQLLPELRLRAGYDFATAIKSYDTEGEVHSLSQLHLLHADAVYSLSKKLSLTAELRTPLSRGATRWYGYAPQSMLLQAGLQVTF